MNKRLLSYSFLFLTFLAVNVTAQQKKSKEIFLDSDRLEIILKPRMDIAWGNVVFRTEDGTYYCDSAVWLRGVSIHMMGNVIIDEKTYHISADSVYHDIPLNEFTAYGQKVELWSKGDSLFSVGRMAKYNRNTRFFYMEQRPTLFLKYPDTLNMIEVRGDYIEYDTQLEKAEARDKVIITSKDFSTLSGCAIMFPRENTLHLSEKPIAKRKYSKITGEYMTIFTENDIIRQIDVQDSARGEFNEPVDSLEVEFDRSILSGKRIIFDFKKGELDKITCFGQAYSWYYPSSAGKKEFVENTVSGDTIKFSVKDEKLTAVEVVGGAIGTYVNGEVGKTDKVDSLAQDSLAEASRIDTINYEACYINYNMKDSIINLQCQGHVTSGQVELDAYKITFDTRSRIIEAFSADIKTDSLKDNFETLEEHFNPNEIPVILKDGEDELYGDYLEYSTETRKGRIVQSKSNYEQGTYFGEKVYRSKRNIFYVKNGRYTPCDINYLHFFSCNMKLIEKNKLIARPVVMYVGRLPVIALPYYVFPLKKGRHSGFLPFTLGNIERGDRYIRNVGYYWAASEYWDYQFALDYFERQRTVNLYNRLNYNKRYTFTGYVAANYTRETGYLYTSAVETERTRWTIKGEHVHDISPTFKISASGQYQSDATYYNDYSADLDDRLNRNTTSKINFSKRFSKSVSLSGNIYHDINLDTETRTTKIPTLNLSLPRINPFGSGKLNQEGKLEQRWYHNFIITYRPGLSNYSRRSVVKEVVDSDTLSYRSRREYSRIDHNANLSFTSQLFKYITFNPSFNYEENWFKIYETDQSQNAGIDASTTYRTFSYNGGVSLSTKIYGTIYPNIFGLIGFRQVLTPTVGYRFTPDINRHPEIRSFAGGGAGSNRSSVMTFSLNQVYQAKVQQGPGERNLDLVSINSGFSYDFENTERPFSDLSTTFSSTLIPGINFYGSMVHSLYKPNTNELSFFSPYLESFEFNTTFSLNGRYFIFNDPDEIMSGTDSLSEQEQQNSSTSQRRTSSSSGGKNWNMTVSYNFRESGRDIYYSKSSFIRMNLSFWLTPNTSISYSQYYNFNEHNTVNNQVNITRQMVCWTGNFFWVPIGSNRGYGFKLYVTSLPAIKIDNSQNNLSSGYLQSLR